MEGEDEAPRQPADDSQLAVEESGEELEHCKKPRKFLELISILIWLIEMEMNMKKKLMKSMKKKRRMRMEEKFNRGLKKLVNECQKKVYLVFLNPLSLKSSY
ncbi:hypothetical protein X975_22031, partial [Stegodyphus mimosarum]